MSRQCGAATRGPRYARVGPQPGRRGHTALRDASPTGQIPQGGGHTEGGSARGQGTGGAALRARRGRIMASGPARIGDWKKRNRRPCGRLNPRVPAPCAWPDCGRRGDVQGEVPDAPLVTRTAHAGWRAAAHGAERRGSAAGPICPRRPRGGLRPEPCGSHIRDASGRLRPRQSRRRSVGLAAARHAGRRQAPHGTGPAVRRAALPADRAEVAS